MRPIHSSSAGPSPSGALAAADGHAGAGQRRPQAPEHARHRVSMLAEPRPLAGEERRQMRPGQRDDRRPRSAAAPRAAARRRRAPTTRASPPTCCGPPGRGAWSRTGTGWRHRAETPAATRATSGRRREALTAPWRRTATPPCRPAPAMSRDHQDRARPAARGQRLTARRRLATERARRGVCRAGLPGRSPHSSPSSQAAPYATAPARRTSSR